MEKRLVLASGSPRRKVLLEQVGLVIDVVPSGIEETVQEGEDPENRVVRLARQKAVCVASRLRDRWVIGADTIVLIDTRILGKPHHPGGTIGSSQAMRSPGEIGRFLSAASRKRESD